MERWRNFYVNGEWITPDGAAFPVVSPSTEAAFAEITLGTRHHVNRAVAAAQGAFSAFSQSTRDDRLALLDRMIGAFEARLEDIACTISEEMGAPLWFARKYQAPEGLRNLRSAREVLAKYRFEDTIGDARIFKEPAGVCAMITPWNWPINQIAAKVGPALAAGCTMVLKPSEVAPLNAVLFAEVVHEAGVPAGVFNLIQGTGEEVGSALSEHPDVDLVSFTGSTRAGIAVSKAAAPTVKRVALELGGKSANILLPSADLVASVRQGVRACYNNSGQSCNAPSRMLVPKARISEVEEVAAEAAKALRVGPADGEGVDLGPLANRTQFEIVQKYIGIGREAGAKLLTGGEGRAEGLKKGFFARPTVFSEVDNQMAIAREEIFGPVLSILAYEDVEEAVALANDSEFGLSGYVVGEPGEALAVAKRLRTGNVHLNGAPQDIAAPFGGYKMSGVRRERGVFGLEEFLEIKAVYGA